MGKRVMTYDVWYNLKIFDCAGENEKIPPAKVWGIGRGQ
jgi:hypothetical protein